MKEKYNNFHIFPHKNTHIYSYVYDFLIYSTASIVVMTTKNYSMDYRLKYNKVFHVLIKTDCYVLERPESSESKAPQMGIHERM